MSNSSGVSLEGVKPGMEPEELLYRDSIRYRCVCCERTFQTWQGTRDHQQENCEEGRIDLVKQHLERWIPDTAELDWWVSEREDVGPDRRTMQLGDALHLKEDRGIDVVVAEPPRGGPA
jgi:hypothetical protein